MTQITRGNKSIGLTNSRAVEPSLPIPDFSQSPTDIINELAQKLAALEIIIERKADADQIRSLVAISDEAILIQAKDIVLAGTVTFVDLLKDWNGVDGGSVDPSITRIRGGVIQTGIILSNNWGSLAGSSYNLDDGTITIGGSAAPSLRFDGTNLSVKGSITAGSIIAGTVTTTGGTTIDTIREQAAAAFPSSSFDSTLNASLAAGVGFVVSGEGGDYRLNVGASSFVAKHKDASELGVSPYAGTLRTGLIGTANGIAMGYNRKDTGAWVTAVAIDSTGNMSLGGLLSVNNLIAGTLNAEVTTTNNLILSTSGKIYTSGKTSAVSTTAGVFLGWDTNEAISAYKFVVGDSSREIRWNGSSLTVIGDIIGNGNLQANAVTADKILANTITGDKISSTFTTTSNLVLTTNGKLYTEGKTSAVSTTAGVFLGWDTNEAISAYKFVIGDSSKEIRWNGSAFTLTNVDLDTNGILKSTGGTLSIDITASIVGQPSNVSVAGVVGRSTNSFGVYGRSTNGAGLGGVGVVGVAGEGATGGIVGNSGVFGIYFDTGIGVRGFGSNVGVFGQGVVGGRFNATLSTGVALDVQTGYIAKSRVTNHVLEVWLGGVSQGVFEYEFRKI